MHALMSLLRKDGRVLRNLRQAARAQSVFKIVFILIFAAGLLAGLGVMFLEGFRFLGALGGIGVMLIRHLFALFFFGLGLMLIFSNIITTYTTVFNSDEIPFLLCRPITPGEILLHKWMETTLISSWAFFFIIIPFIGAFAWYEHLSLFFILWTFLFSVPFVLLYAGGGTLITLLVLCWAPRWRPRVWVGAAALASIGWGGWALFGAGKPQIDDAAFILERFVPGLKLAAFPLWPSAWMVEGIMALSRGQWLRGGLLFGVLLANVLLIGLLVEVLGNARFVQAWQRSRASLRAPHPARNRFHRRQGYGGQDGGMPALERLLSFLAPDTRAIIVKDLRTLLRDPAQWIQGLLFFGLLALYFFNLRNLHYHLLSAVWRNLIVFLNMFSLAAVMCSFCARFIYPQLSLEGQAFWLIGLAPTTMGRVLRIKFLVSLAGMLVISVALMAVSAAMLDVGGRVWVTALGLAVAISLGLCGLATGLGAVFLDLKQRNPMAIISGFGGTLNLALSLAYMTATILPFGALCHYYTQGRIGSGILNAGTAAAWAWLIVITLTAVLLPLAAGRRSLMRRDY
jgi:ABC-2 type transport system permease protein